MKNIFETAREDDRLSTSIRMIQAGGLAETLRGKGEFTAFFPTNEAFFGFPGEVLDAITDDREKLAGMIMYHVVQGKLTTRAGRVFSAVLNTASLGTTISRSDRIIRITAKLANTISLTSSQAKRR